MSLTGWPLIVLLGVLCVALPASALVTFDRRHGGGLAIVSCVALLVAGQLAAISMAAAAANRAGDYFTTWHDVRTAFSRPTGAIHVDTAATSARPGAMPQAAGTLTGRTVHSFATRSQWASKGKLQSVSVHGASSALTSHAFIYLPPQYFWAKYRNTMFPAAEVFTGYPGNDRNLVSHQNYPGVLRSEISKGHAKPMILVMVKPRMDYRKDTECTDVPAGPLALTFFSQDLTAVVGRHYRVQSVNWGAMGDSTGGYCATKLAMNDPATFHAAVSLSGYYRALSDRTTGALWGGSSVVRNLNDLRWQLKYRPAPAVSLLVTISKDEKGHLGYGDTEQFIKLAKPPLQLDSIITAHGGHNFTTWSVLMPRSVDWLSTKLTQSEAVQ